MPVKSEQTTNFVLPLTAAQSFNRSMWHANGRQIGSEARAAMSAGRSYSTFWAPVINLASEPRWGRNLETAGEDPYLNGEYSTRPCTACSSTHTSCASPHTPTWSFIRPIAA